MQPEPTHANGPGNRLPPLRSKESKLKLSLETRHLGDVIIVHCEGRIVYRDEAAALTRVVVEALQHTREVVLDLEGVERIDSAGLGRARAHPGVGRGQWQHVEAGRSERAPPRTAGPDQSFLGIRSS